MNKMTKHLITTCLIGLGLTTWLGTRGLTAMAEQTNSIQLTAYKHQDIGAIAQMDTDETGQAFVINNKGELWQLEPAKKLASGLATHIAIEAGKGRVAAADEKGHFFLWTPDRSYHSTISLAPDAGMQALGFATIAVITHQDQHHLARIETQGKELVVTATSDDPVLPDAKPRQLNLAGGAHSDGHIAVLAKPDTDTYAHGALGDQVEAAEIQYLERHNLKPLAKSLTLDGLVIENNQLTLLEGKTPQLVAVLSGQGAGARAALISLKNKALTLEAQSSALPSQRWQSPFIHQGQLYAIQMPHLAGHLVRYQQAGQELKETRIQSGLSNHIYGAHQTDLTASTAEYTLIPLAGYRQVALLDKKGQVQVLPDQLPAAIQQTAASPDTAYLLLEDGSLWTSSKAN